MLTVAKITSTHATGYADYLEGKTTPTEHGDYYLKDGERVEAPGRWIAGATTLNIDPTARVTGEQLRTLMDVRRPDTGQLLRPPGSSGEAVSALDATFSAPKSVSAVWAIADSDLRAQVEQAHETAIDRAITYATRQVPMVRERIDRQTVIHTRARELIATGWRHTTARGVDGSPDPQLHTHVLLHAAIRRDGQTVAIDSRAWLTHRREVGAAYRTELARELTTLGFDITRATGRGHRYFEVDGVPQDLLDRWSSRHHQVRDAIQARLDSKRGELHALMTAGGPDAEAARRRLRDLDADGVSAAEDRFLTETTRAAKQPTTRADLDALWTHTATHAGFSADHLSGLRDPERPALAPAPERLEAQLTEHDATLTRSHARAIALEQNAGLPIRDSLVLLAAMREEEQLLTLADGSLTTRSHRSREHATGALAERLTHTNVDRIPPGLVQDSADRLDQQLHELGGSLSLEQRAALTLSCSDAQLVVIEGQAGTGKSTVLAGVADAHEAAGQTIIVTSTSALAAQRLADELQAAGTHPAAYSTVALDHAVSTGRVELDPATTIIHDEAALASTRELHGLLDHAETSGARMILVGDPRQSPAVGAGGLWPHIHTAAHTHDAHATLTHNLRALNPADAAAQRAFRDGDTETALTNYHQRERLHLHPEQRTAEDAALDAAFTDQQAGRRTVVIAQTSNDHLDELNARAQAIRHQHHQLGDAALPLTGRPYQLHAGEQIQLRASTHHPDLGPIRNGTTATIDNIDTDAHTAQLTLSDGRQGALTRNQLDTAQARLAHVVHPFPAQGTTTDTAHVIVGEHATQQGTYVALTRARHSTHLHAAPNPEQRDQPPLDQIAERVSRTDPDTPSISQPLAHEASVRDQIERVSRITRPADRTSTRGADVIAAERVGHAIQHTRKTNQLAQRRSQPKQASEGPDQGPIHAYRVRYGVDHDHPHPLGPDPAPDAFRQRLDRQNAARLVLDNHELSVRLAEPIRELLQDIARGAKLDASRGSSEGTNSLRAP